jgi:hypothetical protein
MYAQTGVTVLGLVATAGMASGDATWNGVLAVASTAVVGALAWAAKRRRHNARAAGLP